MKRRSVLCVANIGIVALSGCSTTSDNSAQSRPASELYGDHPIVYSHDELRTTGPDKPVAAGESIAFTVTNTSDSVISLVGGSSWTIQRETDGSWQELIWTTNDALGGGERELNPGESHIYQFELSRAGIEDKVGGTVRETISTGTYRFVVLGTEPFVAIRFRVEET